MRKQTRYNKARKVLSSLGVIPPNYLAKTIYTLIKREGFDWNIRSHEWEKLSASNALQK